MICSSRQGEKYYLWLVIMVWQCVGAAYVLTLDEAKREGKVSETLSGYNKSAPFFRRAIKKDESLCGNVSNDAN